MAPLWPLLLLLPTSLAKLEQVQIIWRHGDRVPYATMPTDEGNGADSWPVGLGELTNEGILQAYQLGQQLRETYGYLLPNGYDAKKTLFTSGDENRTIASGSAVLAGLFPPTPSQKWNEALPWIPVAQHTDEMMELTEATDMVKHYCPALAHLQTDPRLKAVAEPYSDLFALVQRESGFNVSVDSPLFKMTDVWDILYVETERGHERPAWATDQVFERIKSFYFAIEMAVYDLSPVLPMSAGWTLGKIAQSMRDQRDGAVNHKIIGVSAHDLNILPLLSLARNGTWGWPEYTANIRFELHSQPDQIKIKYQSKTNGSVVELEFVDCPLPCSLEAFLDVADNLAVSTSEWFDMCGMVTEQSKAIQSQLGDKNIIIAVLGVTVALVALLLVINVSFLVRHGKTLMAKERGGSWSSSHSSEHDPLLRTSSRVRRGFVADK